MNIKTLIVIAVLLVGGFFAKNYLFPNDADIIRQRMDELAAIMTKEKKENIVGAAQKLNAALDYFKEPVRLKYTYSNDVSRLMTLKEKSLIKERLVHVKFSYPWLIVSFEDTFVDVQDSIAEVTTRTRLVFQDDNGKEAFDLYDTKMDWEKIEGDWFIRGLFIERVENP